MTDYARDHLGRPVSEDGHWVWDGTEWAARSPEERADAEPAPSAVATLAEPQPQTPDVVEQPAVDYFPEPTPQPVEPVEVPVAYEPVVAPEPSPVAVADPTATFQAPPVMDFRSALAANDDDTEQDEHDMSADVFGAPKPVGHRAIRGAQRSRAGSATASFDAASRDEMTLGRLAATTVGVVLSLAGALMFAVAVATILIMRAFQNAMEEAMTTGNSDAFAGAGPGGDTQTTMVLVYALAFAVATLAAFSVLYAAKVPKAIIGAAGIVVLSFAAFYGIDKSGVEMQSWTGILLLPLVPAIATAGFIKWATR